MAQGFTTGIPVPLPVNKGGTGVVTSTGTGSAVLSDAPTFTTGITTPKITFNSTSGIIGTTTNDNAAAGSVGELITASDLSATLSLTSATATNVVSISLTAGDWDVTGYVAVGGTTTSMVQFNGWISSISATLPAIRAQMSYTWSAAALGQSGVVVPGLPFSLASTTTIYLSMSAAYTGGTAVGLGQINARRVR